MAVRKRDSLAASLVEPTDDTVQRHRNDESTYTASQTRHGKQQRRVDGHEDGPLTSFFTTGDPGNTPFTAGHTNSGVSLGGSVEAFRTRSDGGDDTWDSGQSGGRPVA
jgi:hypothetical protein